MSSVSQALKEAGPEGPASRCFVRFCARFSELLGHSLLGDQEDCRHNDLFGIHQFFIVKIARLLHFSKHILVTILFS